MQNETDRYRPQDHDLIDSMVIGTSAIVDTEIDGAVGMNSGILTEADIPDILELYLENPEYFKHCPPSPSRETVKDDMVALPLAKKMEDKHYIGFFDGNSLVAVMDLIDQYPDERTAFIGLLMVAKNRQGKGIGTFIVKALSEALKAKGYMRIRLGYIKTNLPAQSFWFNHGFRTTGAESVGEHYTVIEAEKML